MTTKKPDTEEPVIQALFDELRDHDAKRTPPFDASWEAARVRARRPVPVRLPLRAVAAGGVLALAAAAAIVIMVLHGRQAPAPPRLGVTDPEPLAFLLDRPGGPR